MWVRTYLTKLVQHVLPGDAHVLQHEVAIVNVLIIHFGTDVSCSYACSGRKHSLLTSTWTFFSPFCVRLGISKEGHVLLCFFPSMGGLARGVKQASECLVAVCIDDPSVAGVGGGQNGGVKCGDGQSSPGCWLRRRLGLDMPEDTLNLPLDKKVEVNDNDAMAICLGLVLAIMTLSLGPMFYKTFKGKTGRAPAQARRCPGSFTWAEWMVLKAAYLHDEGMHTVALPMDVQLSEGHCVGCWPSHCEKKNSPVALRHGTAQTLPQLTAVSANCVLGLPDVWVSVGVIHGCWMLEIT